MALASGWGGAAYGQQRAWETDAGAYLSYDFGGAGPGRFGFGLEVRRIYAQQRLMCGSGFTGYAGVAGRLSLLGWDQVRILVAPAAGWQGAGMGPRESFGGEVGLGYRLVSASGPFVQPGVEGGLASLIFLRADHAFGRESESRAFTHSGSMDLGARLPPEGSQGCFVTGRPLRRDAQVAPLPVPVLGPRHHPTPSSNSDEEDAAARVWAGRAAAEWASVPAFWELAEQLAACGAPESLQARAIEAAEQEIGHALHAASFAASLANAELALEPPVLVPREPVGGRQGLQRLALESWTDGCVGEGAAAARAAAEAETAEAAAIRSGQRVVAAEERGHAELGWDILSWALASADRDTRTSILGFINQEENPHAGTTQSDDGGLAAFGCLSGRALGRVTDQHKVGASSRLASLTRDFRGSRIAR